MKMYTKDGAEVLLFKKIEDGYLAKQIYYNSIDDEGEEIDNVQEEILFYEKLYHNPPTEKLAKEVEVLKKEAEILSSKITELKQLKSTEECLLNKISKFYIIKQLADYLTGNFKFVLFLNTMESRKRDSIYISQYIRTSISKNEPFALYELKNEYYISDSDDKPLWFLKLRKNSLSKQRKG